MTDPTPLIRPGEKHPVDRLVQVRELLKVLKEEEATLRAMITSGACSLVGDEWKATTKPGEFNRIALERARTLLPPHLFAAVVQNYTFTRVFLTRIKSNRTQEALDGA